MSKSASMNGVVTLTVDSVAKRFTAVSALNFDYYKGMVNVVDASGSFFFSIKATTSLTYTITTGIAATHTVVMT